MAKVGHICCADGIVSTRVRRSPTWSLKLVVDSNFWWAWQWLLFIVIKYIVRTGYGQNGDKPERRHAKTATPKRQHIALTKTATN